MILAQGEFIYNIASNALLNCSKNAPCGRDGFTLKCLYVYYGTSKILKILHTVIYIALHGHAKGTYILHGGESVLLETYMPIGICPRQKY